MSNYSIFGIAENGATPPLTIHNPAPFGLHPRMKRERPCQAVEI
jgi:hypothetical protein